MATKFSISAVYKALDQFTSPVKKMDNANKKFTRNIKSDFAKAQLQVEAFSQSARRNLGRGLFIGGAAAIGGATLAVKKFVSEASKVENVIAAFQPLVGGVENAKNIVEKLNQTAATTPFQLENLAGATKTLLGFGAATQDTIIPILRMLGDTAGGNSEKLDSVSLAFGKIQAKGKASMKEINQLINAGVPIINELNKSLGTSGEELFDMVRAGKVTNKVITKTFQDMTSEGGIFFKGMEIASKTLTGRFSTFKDNVDLTAASIGNALLPLLKKYLNRGIEIAAQVREWVNNNQDLIKQYVSKFVKALKIVIKTIVVFTKIISTLFKILKPFIPLILGAIAGWKAYQAILIIAAMKQVILNAVMMANPIGLLITSIGALVAAIVWMVFNWDTVVDVLKKVWSFMLKVWELGKGLAMFFGGPFIAPFVMVIEVIRNLVKEFDNIKKTFTDSGFLAGIRAIGKAILDGIVSPFKATIELFNKLKTGVSKFFGGGNVNVNTEQQAPTPVSTTRETISRSISESRNTTEVKVTNEGTTKVQTDSGIVNPGNSLTLQPSG